ncbi:sodium- and chloride-dependent glycine transporter 1-like [Haliotis asinina]|uniref:sodium- and chloride-dependent glycine transporter 1-like n=1 Tax=Haliotis asinina TaxID=109174 RepID=UPI003531C9A1
MTKKHLESVTLHEPNVISCDEHTERAQWSNAFQGVIAQLGFSVGLGNLWRFPYVCQRNGGGAFLIPHIICIVVVAIPLFFLEVAIGQFSRKGPIRVWAMCPSLKGIGYGILIANCVSVPYYSMVFTWALYYLYSSFSTVLPWTSCGNAWNTQQCVAAAGSSGGTNSSTMNPMLSRDTIVTADSNISGIFTNAFGHTSTEEFWQYKVLVISSSLNNMGSLQPHLVICWFLTCVSMFLCLMKGVKSLGKVVYVTATMPYVLLTTLLVRASMMPGAADGISFYLTPDFMRLQNAQVWLEALLHVFYSSGPAWGSLIVIASHNAPRHNIVRDSIVVVLLGELTSVYAGFIVFATVGFLAHNVGVPVADVITSGPGIAFVVYPEAVSLLPVPQLWSVLFFLVVLMMGFDTMFGAIEAATGCVEDILPKRFHKKHLPTVIAAVFMGAVFLSGLIFTSNAGVYMFQLVDWYVGAVACLVVAVLECLVVGWLYGVKRFSVDVEAMIGKRLPVVFKLMCFIVVPVLLLASMILTIASYKPPTYAGYEYPPIAVTIGWCIAVLPVVPIPVTIVIYILMQRGSFAERVKKAMTPSPEWQRCRQRYGFTEEANVSYKLKENLLHVFNR